MLIASQGIPKQANGLASFEDVRNAMHQEGISLSENEIREPLVQSEHGEQGILSGEGWR